MRWNVYLATGTPLYNLRINELKSFVESHPKVHEDDDYHQEVTLAYNLIDDPKDRIRLLREPLGDVTKAKKVKEIDWERIMTAIDAVCARHALTWTSIPTETL